MSGFVWFDLRASDQETAASFYSDLLGWDVASGDEGPATITGNGGPWAFIVGQDAGAAPSGWVPYIQVDDVDDATAKAVELGAQVLAEKQHGPAGAFATLADPTGAAIALWQPA